MRYRGAARPCSTGSYRTRLRRGVARLHLDGAAVGNLRFGCLVLPLVGIRESDVGIGIVGLLITECNSTAACSARPVTRYRCASPISTSRSVASSARACLQAASALAASALSRVLS